MDSGFIKVFRKVTEWEWFHDHVTAWSFVMLILKANWKDGRFEGRDIKRGQFVASRGTLSKYLGISPKSLRTIETKLKSTNELAIESTNKFTIYTIVNYSKYQDVPEAVASEPASQGANEGQTKGKPRATIEELKNSKKKEEPLFSEEVLSLTELLISRIVQNNPNSRLNNSETRKTCLANWCGDIDKLLRIDKRTPASVRDVINWSQSNQFWQGNILSANKLRDKWDQLTVQMNRTSSSFLNTYQEASCSPLPFPFDSE